ncbi:hypothetical protein [Fluoribacter gormanii]|uniref:hypothetical protein n=1 Tax=Fluoribacter gormanii TaxID=464 RepID=UPI000731AA8E|nr:hypothetical protein [Fluoribacter gormanii]KTD00420.1 hypothetical protein Lgor_2896 [Fluoribacter gormanii]
MFRDMYNLPITTASIAPFNKMAYEQLELFETKVLLRCRHRYGDKPIPQHQTSRLERIYDTVVEQALAWHESQPPLVLQKILRGRPKQRPGHNLLRRLSNHLEEVLRFLHDAVDRLVYYEACGSIIVAIE